MEQEVFLRNFEVPPKFDPIVMRGLVGVSEGSRQGRFSMAEPQQKH
jgi:hypothetical protein